MSDATQETSTATYEMIDAGGRTLIPGFVETHIHLDKSCILGRCASKKGDLTEATSRMEGMKGKKSSVSSAIVASAASSMRQ